MRTKILSKLLAAPALLALTFVSTFAQTPTGDAAKLLPPQVGDFRVQPLPSPVKGAQPETIPMSGEDYHIVSQAAREYASGDGESYVVSLFKTRSASAAYSLLRRFGSAGDPSRGDKFQAGGELGVVYLGGDKIAFIKGTTLIMVSGKGEPAVGQEAVIAFAKQLAPAIEGDFGSVPVLVLHLPEWEKAHEPARLDGVGYAVTLDALRMPAGASAHPVLEAVSFDGGTEAATATYDGARLVVIEFTTPQHAVEMDTAINARIAELRGAGRPVPTAYKRVGNYSVFVFDARDAAAAERLVSGVKYEKDVRWLGRNPHGDEIAQRAYTNTMTGVVVTVFKTSGLAIIVCLGVGAVFGSFVFMRRRARVSAVKAYSDGGEMLRLNLLDDVPATQPATNLLGPGKE